MVSYSKYLFMGAPFVALAALGVLWWQKREKKRTFMEVGRVTELFVYPVKSCKGIKLTEARCLKEGMEFDRNWIILNEKGQFVCQRKAPGLALVVPHFEDNKYLCLDAPGMKTLKIDLHQNEKESKEIRVWGSNAEGQYAGDEAADWFSKYLNKPNCSLYKLSKARMLPEEKNSHAIPDDRVSFADAAPYMMATEGTLERVNNDLKSPVTIDRFRPNIVISGPAAFGEYKWEGKRIKLGDVEFRFLMICTRCSIPTVNPETGEKQGAEPVATLKRLKASDNRLAKYGNCPLFGVYVAPVRNDVGIIRIEDSVMIEM